nr:hypothetical protein GCM10025730_23000 [Promicromonospora thailandica]
MSRTARPRALRLGASALALALTSSAGLAAAAGTALAPAATAAEDRTAALVGSLQDELGCAADWDPACAATELVAQGDGTFTADFEIPAGTYEYKVALDDTWDESYGRDGGPDNAPLHLAGPATVRVTYDDTTHRTALTPLTLAGSTPTPTAPWSTTPCASPAATSGSTS